METPATHGINCENRLAISRQTGARQKRKEMSQPFQPGLRHFASEEAPDSEEDFLIKENRSMTHNHRLSQPTSPTRRIEQNRLQSNKIAYSA